MRLIDAHALAKDFEKNCVNECACCTKGITHTVHVGTYAARIHESCGLIVTAPTVDAIPVEWLERKRDDTSEEGKNPDLFLNMACDMVLNMWEVNKMWEGSRNGR